MARTSKKDEKGKKNKKKLQLQLKKKLNKTQKIVLAIVLVLVITIGATYGTRIVKLKAQNRQLKQQNAELKEEQSKLTKELKNVNSKEYVQEQARKKLRLLNKDEILFIFKDEDKDGKKKN